MEDDSTQDMGDAESQTDSEEDLSHTQPETWAVGDECLVKWSVDKKRYPARITKFRKTTTITWALVSFCGFDEEDDEWVDTKRLQHIPRGERTRDDDVMIVEDPTKEILSPIFSPLKGNEEKQRMAEKFRHLDDDIKPCSSLLAEKRWPTTKKRLVLDQSSQPKSQRGRSKRALDISGGETRKKSSQSAVATPKRDVATATRPRREADDTLELTNLSDSGSNEGTSAYDGFSGEDLEKPYFPKSPGGDKIPLLLSEPGEEPEIKVPATINRYLREYQRDGVRFLYKHYSSGHGALLADDMGLGKTVQVISFIAALLGRTGTKADILAQKPSFIRRLSENIGQYKESPKRSPFLVIGPASVLYNWIDEFETWGYFKIGKYHKQHKQQTLADVSRGKLDVVVTTYETFRDNVDELNSCDWEAIIADEVHKIKGLKAEVTKSLRKCRCLRRFGLSGTPLQNNVKELWSLLDWCYPDCLGNMKEFNRKYGKTIEDGQKHNATKRQLADARKAQAKFSVLRNQWMLRRTKAIIKDELPQKSEMVVYCRPTTLQVSVYKAIFDLKWMEYVLKQRDPCPCGSERTRGTCCYRKIPLPPPDDKSVRSLTMSYMHLLLKAASHIALLLPSHTNNENQKREAEIICKTVFSDHPQFIRQTREAAFKTLSDPKFCGKMKVLQGLLSVFRKQRCKVLVFSYSTKLLDILETYVMSMGYEYHRLDGKTKEVSRVQLVRDFNSNPNTFLFLISTRAGGVGLNLTGANVVIIFDPNWNPTHDLQAQDRAYRIGQRRDVRVYRLITSGTIEENIYLRQIYKQQLGDVAVATKNAKRLFYTNELFGIESTFHFRTGDRCLTEDILKRHSKIEEGLRHKEVVSSLDQFDIEEYVPCKKEEKRNDEDTTQESTEEEEEHNLKDSDAKNFGLNYICTQLMDLETGTGDEVMTSEGRNNEVMTSQGQNDDDSDDIVTPQGREISADLVTPRDPDIKDGGKPDGHGYRKRKKEDENESMDNFLDDLLDLGAPPKKSPKCTPIKVSPVKSRGGGVSKRSPDKRHVAVKRDLWADLDVGDCHSEEEGCKQEVKEEDPVLGGLWEEMESLGNTEEDERDKVRVESRATKVKSQPIKVKAQQTKVKFEQTKVKPQGPGIKIKSDRSKVKSQNSPIAGKSADREVKNRVKKNKVKRTIKHGDDSGIDDLFKEMEEQSDSGDSESEREKTTGKTTGKAKESNSRTRARHKRDHVESDDVTDLLKEMEEAPETESGSDDDHVKAVTNTAKVQLSKRSNTPTEKSSVSVHGISALKKVPGRSALKRTSSEKTVIPDDDNIIEFVLNGKGTMECDFDSDFDDKQRSSSSRKKRKPKPQGKKTVRISESRNQVHENDLEEEQPPRIRKSVGFVQESCDIPSTFNSVSDVFADCGVVHMHQNRKVTGSSKAEDHMSRCAIKEVYELNCNSQAPALLCDRRSSSSPEESSPLRLTSQKKRTLKRQVTKATTKNGGQGKKTKKTTLNLVGFFHGPRSVIDGNSKILIGQTPKSVRRQQFVKLAKHICGSSAPEGQSDQVRFAHQLLSSSRNRHVRWLRDYYGHPDQGLGHLVEDQGKS